MKWAGVACALLIVGCGSSSSTGPQSSTAPATQARPRPGVKPCRHGKLVVDQGRRYCGEAALRHLREKATTERFGFDPTGALDADARRIMADDRTLRAMLRGRRTRVLESGPWSAGDRPLGAFARIELTPPFAGTATFPYVCKGDPALGSGRTQLRLREVTRLMVMVDARLHHVAEITLDEAPGGPAPKVLGGKRLPGSVRCPPSRD